MWVDVSTILTTLILYTVAVVSPGPSFALVSRLAISGRYRTAVGASVGMAVGGMAYAVLTMAGLAVLLDRIAWLARAVQVAGGCYLIYLGLMAWRSAGHAHAAGVDLPDRGHGQGLRTGILVYLSNPKTIAFFISLYALAVPPETALWAKAAIVAGGFAIDVGWYLAVTFALSTRRARAAYGRFGAWIERLVGTLLAAFGIRLIWERA